MKSETIVSELFKILKKEKIPIKELAKKMGKPKQYFYELKRRQNVSVNEIEKILNHVGYRVECVFIKPEFWENVGEANLCERDMYEEILQGYKATEELLKYLKPKN